MTIFTSYVNEAPKGLIWPCAVVVIFGVLFGHGRLL